jgi:hypothetical protein
MPMNTLNQAFIELTSAQGKAIGEIAKLPSARGKLRLEETNVGPAGTVGVTTNRESLFIMPNGKVMSLERGLVWMPGSGEPVSEEGSSD